MPLHLLCLALAASALAAPRTRRADVKPPRKAAASGGVTGQACIAGGAPYQSWAPAADGTLRSSGGCLTAASWPPVFGDTLAISPCASPAVPQQQFKLSSGGGANAISLVFASNASYCVNLKGYGVTPGTEVWTTDCSASLCKENCNWQSGAAAGSLVNPASALCLDAGTEPPPPPAPHTCDAGSPSAGLPFCDATLPVTTRVEDLWSRLTAEQRIALFSIPIQPNVYDPVLNLKSVYWDITCS